MYQQVLSKFGVVDPIKRQRHTIAQVSKTILSENLGNVDLHHLRGSALTMLAILIQKYSISSYPYNRSSNTESVIN